MSKPNGSPGTGADASPDGGGIIEREERHAAEAIAAVLADLGFAPRPLDLRAIPFAGTWGAASSVCYALANEVVTREMEAAGELEGLSKKEAKRRAADAVRGRAQELAEQIAGRMTTTSANGFARVEAVNGYVNVYFDANTVAARLIGEVLGQGAAYGAGEARPERVMVEHSQPNTHKAFHVGHLRNSCVGVAVSRIMRAAGYDVQDANYIGDIGLHVIAPLVLRAVPPGRGATGSAARGRWLGEVYAVGRPAELPQGRA